MIMEMRHKHSYEIELIDLILRISGLKTGILFFLAKSVCFKVIT